MSWDDKFNGRCCYDCGARRRIEPWVPPWVVAEYRERCKYARCVDSVACAARRAKRRDRASVRGSVLVLREAPSPSYRPGWCRWCGLELRRRADGNPARRDRCDLQREGRDCAGEYRRSRTYTRHAVRERDRAIHGRMICATCRTTVEGPDTNSGDGCQPWAADHIVPLEDGGAHTLTNLQVLCVPCHTAKTSAENSRRRAVRSAS